MPVLTVRHVTTYRYKQPVAFGEHRMMLRPRDSHDQRLLDTKLAIGVAYAGQETETLPVHERDHALDMVVTEKGVRRFA